MFSERGKRNAGFYDELLVFAKQIQTNKCKDICFYEFLKQHTIFSAEKKNVPECEQWLLAFKVNSRSLKLKIFIDVYETHKNFMLAK